MAPLARNRTVRLSRGAIQIGGPMTGKLQSVTAEAATALSAKARKAGRGPGLEPGSLGATQQELPRASTLVTPHTPIKVEKGGAMFRTQSC